MTFIVQPETLFNLIVDVMVSMLPWSVVDCGSKHGWVKIVGPSTGWVKPKIMKLVFTASVITQSKIKDCLVRNLDNVSE